MSGRLPVILLALAAISLQPRPVHAAQVPGEAAAIFETGNRLYAEGEYAEAGLQYAQLINQGFGSAAVHYNLGNALFKQGRLGEAILEFERASRLEPNDEDTSANLSYLRTLIVDEIHQTGALTTTFFLERLLGSVTLDHAAAMFIAAWLIVGILIGLGIMTPSRRVRRANAWLIAMSSALLLATGILFGVKLTRDRTLVEGVILEAKVDVRSGPGEENTTLFTIHEGLKVRIRDDRGSWKQISLENGLNGWLPADALGLI